MSVVHQAIYIYSETTRKNTENITAALTLVPYKIYVEKRLNEYRLLVWYVPIFKTLSEEALRLVCPTDRGFG